MRSDVLDKLVETHNELWGAGTDVSLQTSRSYKLTRVWQEKLTSIDSKRFVAEYVANKEAGNQSHKIDLVDAVDRVAYELKVSPNNPHFEFYKDVFKVLYANTPVKVIDKLVFCCPLAAERKLGSLAIFVTTLSKQLNLDIEIFYIKDNI
jgi:hypothetical protein